MKLLFEEPVIQVERFAVSDQTLFTASSISLGEDELNAAFVGAAITARG